MRSDLLRRVAALYRRPADGQAEHQRAHEQSLVAAVAANAGSATAARPSRRWPRWLLAGGLGTAVAVGACALPAEYPVSLGRGLEITVDAARFDEVDPDLVAAHLSEELGAERVEVHITREREETTDGNGVVVVHEEVTMQIFAFGDGLDPDLAFDELHDEFPALVEARLAQVPLSGTVQGTIGGKLSRRWLDLTIDEHGVEEAERRIRAELLARGIAPDGATVEISTEEGPGGHREVRVRVEAER